MNKKFFIFLLLAIVLAAFPLSAQAATFSIGTVTVTYPDNKSSCNPVDVITVSGIPAGGKASIDIYWMPEAGGLVRINKIDDFLSADGSVSVSYPTIVGKMYFMAGVAVQDAAGNYIFQVSNLKWDVTCDGTTVAGCTPGYWKNHLDSWPPTGYSPSQDFDATFGVNYFKTDINLGVAIGLGGGGYNKIARHGTAALLSAAHPGVSYPFSVAEVIAAVQSGNVDALAAANEMGCPLH